MPDALEDERPSFADAHTFGPRAGRGRVPEDGVSPVPVAHGCAGRRGSGDAARPLPAAPWHAQAACRGMGTEGFIVGKGGVYERRCATAARTSGLPRGGPGRSGAGGVVGRDDGAGAAGDAAGGGVGTPRNVSLSRGSRVPKARISRSEAYAGAAKPDRASIPPAPPGNIQNVGNRLVAPSPAGQARRITN